MTTTSDIKALTLGVKTVFSTTAALDRVKIHNNSSMYLQVYYGADAPNAATDPGWHETIDPGDKPLCGIVGSSAQSFSDRTYIQSTAFQGIITVMPFLPANSTISAGGVLSGGSFCHITGYYPGEYAEGGAGDEAYVLAVKQARHQSVEGAVVSAIGTFDSASGIGNFVFGRTLQLTTASAPFLFAANALGVSFINFYYYGVFMTWGNGIAGNSACNFHLNCALMDSTLTVLRTELEVARYKAGDPTAHIGGNVLPDLRYNPSVTQLQINQGVLQNNDRIAMRFANDATGGTWSIALNAQFMVDNVNQSALTTFGNGVVFGQSAVYSPTTNPQVW